jgi:hypothetical protein
MRIVVRGIVRVFVIPTAQRTRRVGMVMIVGRRSWVTVVEEIVPSTGWIQRRGCLMHRNTALPDDGATAMATRATTESNAATLRIGLDCLYTKRPAHVVTQALPRYAPIPPTSCIVKPLLPMAY